MLYIFTKSTMHAGGSRHRAFFVADFLERAGYDSKIIIPPAWCSDISRTKARLKYIKTIFSLRNDDIVFLQNPIFSTYFIFCIVIVKILFNPTIIFDFDDATWVQNPIAPRVLALVADKFIVASHYLAKWTWIRGKPVLLMPNLVDYTLAERYKAQKENEIIVLGWIGGAPNSMRNLELLTPVLKGLKRKGLPFLFRLVGTLGSQKVRDMFLSTGTSVHFIDTLEWEKEGEIQKANNSFDIGLCPLVDNESNRGRCSLKVLDYMAAGIPVVASPVGENIYFLKGDVGGFLPDDVDEWVEYIDKLIVDVDLRNRKGEEARNRLIKNYSYQSNIQKYIDFLGLDVK